MTPRVSYDFRNLPGSSIPLVDPRSLSSNFVALCRVFVTPVAVRGKMLLTTAKGPLATMNTGVSARARNHYCVGLHANREPLLHPSP